MIDNIQPSDDAFHSVVPYNNGFVLFIPRLNKGKRELLKIMISSMRDNRKIQLDELVNIYKDYVCRHDDKTQATKVFYGFKNWLIRSIGGFVIGGLLRVAPRISIDYLENICDNNKGNIKISLC